MLAWMNAEALRLTRETGVVHFWSRSRQALWKKGETCGNTLALVELRVDCDRDACSCARAPPGPTCHTGATTCFFTRDDGRDDDGVPAPRARDPRAARRDPRARGATPRPARRATRSRCSTPACRRSSRRSPRSTASSPPSCPPAPTTKVVHETADLLFHVMVGLDRAATSRSSACSPSSRAGSAPAVTPRRPRGRSDRRGGDLLAPGGGLERAIPHYEDRAEQRAMSAAVARALDDERPLIVEAGTGTGKTLAYLSRRCSRASASSSRPARARCRIRSRATTSRCCARSSRGRSPRSCSRASRTTCAGASSPSCARARRRPDARSRARRLGRAHRDRRSRRGRVARRGRAAVGRGHDHARRAHRPALPVLRALLRHAGAPARRAGAARSSSTTTSTSPTARCAPRTPARACCPITTR